MEAFETELEVRCVDCNNTEHAPYRMRRVFLAPNLEWARRIADAMIGEVVNQSEYISRVVFVRQTNKVPVMAAWDSMATWHRIIRNLSLAVGDVRYVAGAGVGRELEIVGIEIPYSS